MSGEEKRREEEYPYTDIRIRRENRVTFYVSKNEKRDIYIPTYYVPTLKKLKAILRREGKTLSEWIRDHATEYVRLHEPGNPQQLLPRLLDGKDPYHALVCQKHKQPVPYLMEFVAASGKTLRYCEDCFLEAKERGLVRHAKQKLT